LFQLFTYSFYTISTQGSKIIRYQSSWTQIGDPERCAEARNAASKSNPTCSTRVVMTMSPAALAGHHKSSSIPFERYPSNSTEAEWKDTHLGVLLSPFASNAQETTKQSPRDDTTVFTYTEETAVKLWKQHLLTIQKTHVYLWASLSSRAADHVYTIDEAQPHEPPTSATLPAAQGCRDEEDKVPEQSDSAVACTPRVPKHAICATASAVLTYGVSQARNRMRGKAQVLHALRNRAARGKTAGLAAGSLPGYDRQVPSCWRIEVGWQAQGLAGLAGGSSRCWDIPWPPGSWCPCPRPIVFNAPSSSLLPFFLLFSFLQPLSRLQQRASTFGHLPTSPSPPHPPPPLAPTPLTPRTLTTPRFRV